MGDRPILFSGPMIRALIEGRKTQTRRVLKPQPKFGFKPWQDEDNGEWMQSGYGEAGDDFLQVPYTTHDRLWVREAFSGLHEYEVEGWPPSSWFVTDPIWYWADGNPTDGDWTRPKPSIHMPRWASRLTLTVTEVRVERLQDISEEDVLAEGIAPIDSEIVSYRGAWDGSGVILSSEEKRTRRPAFARLWNSIHGPDAWSENSWVAAVSFSVEHRNIDAPHPTASEGADRE